MSDSRLVHRVIKRTLMQLYPERPQGNLACHLDTLAGMVSGIVLSKSCQLPKIASKVPDEVHPDSRTKQMSRWVQNEGVTVDRYFSAVYRALADEFGRDTAAGLHHGWQCGGPRLCDVDGSACCIAGHALPVAWLVIAGAKGHFPTEAHVRLLRDVKARVPEAAPVTFLGDGEFDSPELQAEANGYGWDHVCRTAKNIQISADGEVWSSLEDLAVVRGTRAFRKGILFTKDALKPVVPPRSALLLVVFITWVCKGVSYGATNADKPSTSLFSTATIVPPGVQGEFDVQAHLAVDEQEEVRRLLIPKPAPYSPGDVIVVIVRG